MNLTLVAFALTFFNLICASFTEEFYSNWIEKYRQISGNQNPPKRIKEWMKLAGQMNVGIEPEKFKPIFEHLAHFKQTGITTQNVRDFLNKIRSFYPERTDIRGYSTYDLMTELSKRNGWPWFDSFSFLSQVLDPSIDCLAIIQKFDEGMVIPADDDDSRQYNDISEIFNRSSSMRSALGEYAKKHILLQAPTCFHGIPFYAPVFGVYRLKGAKDILIATDQTGIGYYEHVLPIAKNSPNWENKIFGAMFRGSATGIGYVKAVDAGIPVTNSPRFKLHQMSDMQKAGKLNCKVPLDFGISDLRIGKCPKNVLRAVHDFKDASHENFTSQFRYKYLVVVDGNGAADRISIFMASGSLVFLSTVLEDWASNQIIAGEHYIKVKPDLSDLVEKLEWAAEHDAEAKRIAQNGREFVLKNMNRPDRQIYNALLFMEYQALFDSANSTQHN